jgi:F420-non-reducing hydrogenase iron-sulfur subunit
MEGNYKTMRRVALLRPLLRALGIEDERLRLEWISASEGEKVARVISEMVAVLRTLGPLDWPGRRARWDGERHAQPATAAETAPAAAALGEG